MLFYCLNCRKNTESKNPKVLRTRKGKTVLLNCAVCGSKKSKFIRKQEASGLLSSLGIRTSSDKSPIFGPILFWVYKMNKIIHKFLLSYKFFFYFFSTQACI